MFLKPDYDRAPAMAAANVRPARKRWSLAARLTAWYALSAFGLILLATSLMYVVLAASFEAESDRYLADQIGDVKSILRSHRDMETRLFEGLREGASVRQHMPVF